MDAMNIVTVETTSLSVVCCGCNTVLPLEVCHSAAGFYVGHFCPNCGPYDRLVGYFGTKESAEKEKSFMLSCEG